MDVQVQDRRLFKKRQNTERGDDHRQLGKLMPYLESNSLVLHICGVGLVLGQCRHVGMDLRDSVEKPHEAGVDILGIQGDVVASLP
ncbi:MAG: hypothetical protein A4E73_00109 [Syntrophaceae bacterium PtaU1.Bin231]|nr:MAG: hypothetical protein A4E73_00109 [Syntrophaceae bacterium PtaU1.Bin231]